MTGKTTIPDLSTLAPRQASEAIDRLGHLTSYRKDYRWLMTVKPRLAPGIHALTNALVGLGNGETIDGGDLAILQNGAAMLEAMSSNPSRKHSELSLLVRQALLETLADEPGASAAMKQELNDVRGELNRRQERDHQR